MLTNYLWHNINQKVSDYKRTGLLLHSPLIGQLEIPYLRVSNQYDEHSPSYLSR